MSRQPTLMYNGYEKWVRRIVQRQGIQLTVCLTQNLSNAPVRISQFAELGGFRFHDGGGRRRAFHPGTEPSRAMRAGTLRKVGKVRRWSRASTSPPAKTVTAFEGLAACCKAIPTAGRVLRSRESGCRDAHDGGRPAVGMCLSNNAASPRTGNRLGGRRCRPLSTISALPSRRVPPSSPSMLCSRMESPSSTSTVRIETRQAPQIAQFLTGA